jgi:hypothetical protein
MGADIALMIVQDVELPRYRPSGAMHWAIFPVIPAALAVAGVVGVIYGVLAMLNPFIIVSVALVFGLGFVTGLIGQVTCRYAHCRNRLAAMAVAISLGVAAVAASYWINYRFDSRTTGASREGAAFSFGQWVDAKKESGWVIRNGQINGPYVTIVWAFEAFFVLGIASILGWAAGNEPYCEQCKAWPKSHKVRLKSQSAEEFWKRMKEATPFAALSSMKESCADASLELDALICDQCHNGFLNVHEETIKVTDGKSEKVRKPIVHGILIDPRTCDSFLAAGRTATT